MAKYSWKHEREYQKTEGLPPEVLGFLISFWGNIQPSPDLNSKYRHFGCHQCYKRLHLVDCVVARSATKLGGLGACPHSREAKINVQYPPLGVILNIWNTTKYPVPFLSIVALKNRLREMANEGGGGLKSWKFCERNKWMSPYLTQNPCTWNYETKAHEMPNYEVRQYQHGGQITHNYAQII